MQTVPGYVYPKAVWGSGEIQYHGRNVGHSDFAIRPCIQVRMTKERLERLAPCIEKSNNDEDIEAPLDKEDFCQNRSEKIG